MTELEILIKRYENRFGIEIPDGKIDEDTLSGLLREALAQGRPIEDTSDFVD